MAAPRPRTLVPVLAGAGAPGGAVDASLAEWLAASGPAFDELLGAVRAAHAERVAWLAAAAGEARRSVWWPFTQHGNVEPGCGRLGVARAGG
jgi:hypothetical protein